jgi:Protein of unknown function (DUF962)
MKSLVEQLSGYAATHPDRRNIAAHFVGIPMIVLGEGVRVSTDTRPRRPTASAPPAATHPPPPTREATASLTLNHLEPRSARVTWIMGRPWANGSV